MSHIQTSPEPPPQMTQHAMLVIWGLFARRIGLVQAMEAVKLKQKTRVHRPQTKVSPSARPRPDSGRSVGPASLG